MLQQLINIVNIVNQAIKPALPSLPYLQAKVAELGCAAFNDAVLQ